MKRQNIEDRSLGSEGYYRILLRCRTGRNYSRYEGEEHADDHEGDRTLPGEDGSDVIKSRSRLYDSRDGNAQE